MSPIPGPMADRMPDEPRPGEEHAEPKAKRDLLDTPFWPGRPERFRDVSLVEQHEILFRFLELIYERLREVQKAVKRLEAEQQGGGHRL